MKVQIYGKKLETIATSLFLLSLIQGCQQNLFNFRLKKAFLILIIIEIF